MNILVIGGGSIGQRHIRNLLFLVPNATITLVSKFSSHTSDFQALPIEISSVLPLNCWFDYIVIASPASHHLEHLKYSLAHTDNIFLEKPLFACNCYPPNLSSLFISNDKFIQVGYVLRFDPIIVLVKSFLDTQQFGSPLIARIWGGQDLRRWRPEVDYRTTVSSQIKLGGGPTHELSHELDYMIHFFGIPTKTYSSLVQNSSLDIDTEDVANFIFEFSSLSAVVSLDFISVPASLGFTIHTDTHTISADFVNRSLSVSSEDSFTDFPLGEFSYNEIYLEQFRYFLFPDHRQSYSPCTYEQALSVFDIIKSAFS